MTTNTLRRLAPLTAAAAALAVVATTAVAVRLDDGSDRREVTNAGGSPLLRLDANGVSATGHGIGGGRYVLLARLPDGPARERVRSLAEADRDRVEALARALGVEAPEEGSTSDDARGSAVAPSTTVSSHGSPGDAPSLQIDPASGYRWSYSSHAWGCPELTASSDEPRDLPVCAVAGGSPGSGGARSAAAPTPAQARKEARPVLAAVGLDPATSVVTTDGPEYTTVVVHPVVDGLPTAGMETAVTVGADGIVSAYGWLGQPRNGREYPVISAKDAFRKLSDLPQPMVDLACPEPLDDTTLPEGTSLGDCWDRDLTIIGAQFGLSLQWGAGEPILVPSWLFEVRGSTYPLAQVAVDPSYLGKPRQKPVPPTEPRGGGGSSEPGDPGRSTDPGEPPVKPAPEAPFQSLEVSRDGRTITVTFYGGIEDCNTYELLAKESDEAVHLVLSHSTPPDAGACIEIAVLREASVTLTEPLGDRRLVDAATNEGLATAADATPDVTSTPRR